MEKSMKKMKKRHAREIKELQENCKHEKSKWMPSMWAPGHLGPNVRVCEMCEKILERDKEPLLPEIIPLNPEE